MAAVTGQYATAARGEVERLLASGQTDAAVNRLEQFVLHVARDEEAVTDLAVLYHLTQRGAAARDLLCALIEERPGSHLARKQLALIELLAGRAAAAFSVIEPTIAAYPHDAEALRILGDVAVAMKLHDRARAFYLKSLSISPADGETRRRLEGLPTSPPVDRFLELRALFEECTEPYALAQPWPRLPAYARGDRLQILCAEPARFVDHLRRTVMAGAENAFRFNETTSETGILIDCVSVGDSKLHLQLDVRAAGGDEQLLSRRTRVMQHGVPLCFLVPVDPCAPLSTTRTATDLRAGQTASPASQDGGANCFVITGAALARSREILASIRAHSFLRIIAVYQRQVASASRLLRQLTRTPATRPSEDDSAPALLIIAARRAGVTGELTSVSTGSSFHASTPNEVERTLQVFNLPPLGYYLREPNPELLAPYHLEPFKRFALHEVPLDALRANLFGRSGVRIQETPHFLFASGDREAYLRYHARHVGRQLTDDHFPEAFEQQVASYDPALDRAGARKSYVIGVRRAGTQFLIIDGLHRASILAARGVPTLTLAEPLYP